MPMTLSMLPFKLQLEVYTVIINFLLQEDGSFLLQEDGFKIVLE